MKDFEEILEELVEEENNTISERWLCSEFLSKQYSEGNRKTNFHDLSQGLLDVSENKSWRKYLHFTPSFGGKIVCEELLDLIEELIGLGATLRQIELTEKMYKRLNKINEQYRQNNPETYSKIQKE